MEGVLNVKLIENNLYLKVCESFSEFAEKRLGRYKTVLEFLKVTDIKIILNNTTLDVYNHYAKFCTMRGYECLDHTVFSRTVCECGFNTISKSKTIEGKRCKLIYFRMQ